MTRVNRRLDGSRPRGSNRSRASLAGMEAELSQLVGRNVDLRTSGALPRYFRAGVLRPADQPLSVVPEIESQKPDRDRLKWHVENRFQP